MTESTPQQLLETALQLLGERQCRECGCTEDDCRGCIERTGEPCRWVEEDLCSACMEDEKAEAADLPML